MKTKGQCGSRLRWPVVVGAVRETASYAPFKLKAEFFLLLERGSRIAVQ